MKMRNSFQAMVSYRMRKGKGGSNKTVLNSCYNEREALSFVSLRSLREAISVCVCVGVNHVGDSTNVCVCEVCVGGAPWDLEIRRDPTREGTLCNREVR